MTPTPTPAPANPGREHHRGGAHVTKSTLATRQAALVAALVAGAPVPPGFDERLVGAAERSLRRKRAGEVAAAWPHLAAALGDRWTDRFARWARGRPSQGALRDGWDLARELAFLGELPPLGRTELAVREVTARYDGRRAPRPRRWPAVRVAPGGVVVGVLGRAYPLGG
ncbi:MAG TPA: hypothetical protein VNP03_03990 [Pseudonocardia sp.]|nr:hypothetical protein [Pseudonocardia sp.]